MSNLTLEKKLLLWKVGQSATFLSAAALSGSTTDVQQLGFLALATAGLVCWGQSSALKKDVNEQFDSASHPLGQEQKHNTVREYVIWGHTIAASGAAAVVSGLTSPLTLGVLALCSAALIANAVDNYQLQQSRTQLQQKITNRRIGGNEFAPNGSNTPSV